MTWLTILFIALPLSALWLWFTIAVKNGWYDNWLQKWAKENAYEILEKSYKCGVWSRKYWLKVKNSTGQLRCGEIKISEFSMGFYEKSLSVRWLDEWTESGGQ
jgi:hypothetical protein